MPVGKYPNFAACVLDHKSKGHTEEEAKKMCGQMEKNTMNEKVDRLCFTEVQFSEGSFDPNAEFEILTTAKHIDSRYGEFQYKQSDLEEMAKNFNEEVVGTDIAVDLNHDQECIALAWIKPASMSVKPSRKLAGEYSLYAQLCKFSPKGEEYVSTGALRYFSVELQFKMDRMISGVKKTFKNVIRGLALTNRPVVKDMNPIFSESNIHNPIQMNKFNEMLEALKAKSIVTKVEFSELKKLADEAVEADAEVKGEVEAATAEVEAKVEEPAKATDEKALAELAEKAVRKALSESGKSTFSAADVAVMLADATKEAIKEPMKRLNEVLDNARGAKLSAQVKGLCLSEDKNVGFKAAQQDKVLAFVKKLSDEMASEYFSIHSDIIAAVDFSEKGVDGAMNDFKNSDVYSELDKKATAYAAEHKVKYTEATKAVLAQDKALSDAINKLENKGE